MRLPSATVTCRASLADIISATSLASALGALRRAGVQGDVDATVMVPASQVGWIAASVARYAAAASLDSSAWESLISVITGRVARANCTAYVSIYLASTDDATSRHTDADIASERQQTLPDEHVAQTIDSVPDVAAELFVAGNRFDLAAFH